MLDAPTVFKSNTPGAWIFPDAVPVETLVAVAHNCPSGAIHYVRKDGGPAARDGQVEICAGTGRTVARTTDTRLCRCGHSKDKPFCDGSHRAAGFVAEGA